MEAGEMNTELVCVVANLGYFDGSDYFKGADCLETLKDLIRFLRREDDSCNIRRQLGYSQVLQKDLLPILIHEDEDKETIDIVVRLLVNLTSPPDICFNKKPDEAEEAIGRQKITSSYQSKRIEVMGYLQSYKEAFINQKVLAAVSSQIGNILQLEWEERSEDDFLMFERLLLLLRNILHVPSNPNEEKRTDDDASIHDQILWNMHVNGIDDLLIYISSSSDETRWAMHTVEIINLMLREQNPEKLAMTSELRTENEKEEDVKALVSFKERESSEKRNAAKRICNTRHSRFGGSFWVKNLCGVGKKSTLVYHKHVADVADISFDDNKCKGKVRKVKQDAVESQVERNSTLTIRLFLKEFTLKFLEHCYNPLMRIVKNTISGKRSQENDESYYLWVLKFFMAFNRFHSLRVELVSETVNMSMFHYILTEINKYYDQFIMHKKGGWEPWQKRLHLALQAYKELIAYISSMDSSNDSQLKDASSIIKNNVFYHESYRTVFITMLRFYAPHKQSRKYLTDLVETFHIFLKILEKYCQVKGSILIKTKKKVSHRKKRSSEVASEVLTVEQLEERWKNDVAPKLSAILQGNKDLPECFENPYDSSSYLSGEEQKSKATAKIQNLIRQGNMEGMFLLRSARDIWPEHEGFGKDGQSPEEEFMVVRNIMFQERLIDSNIENEDEEFEEDDDDEEIPVVRTVEKEFHLKSFMTTLASPQIVRPYTLLLRHYKTNSVFTNHAIVKMLHRVAMDLKLREMFFQLSVFITFQEILNESSPKYKELVVFAKYIVNRFIEFATLSPNIYVEALFWKGSGDCYQISEDDKQLSIVSKPREKWTFEDEEELRSLFDQFKEEEDYVGEILKNVVDKDRTRRQISNKLVRLRLVDSAKDIPRPRKVKSLVWREEEVEELHRVFEEYRNNADPIGDIMATLTFTKSKQAIITRLLEGGKVSDRKQLHKKRRKKPNFRDFMGGNECEQSGEESESVEEQDHEEEEDASDDSSDSSFEDLCSQVKDLGFTEQLTWLQTRLKAAARTRETDPDWHAIPLLTMSESDALVMKCLPFKKLLKIIGLQPPVNEQESFWRIPSSLSPSLLLAFSADLHEGYNCCRDPPCAKAVKRLLDASDEILDTLKNVKRKRTLDEDAACDDIDDDLPECDPCSPKTDTNNKSEQESEGFGMIKQQPRTSDDMANEKLDKLISGSESSGLHDRSNLNFSLRLSEEEN